MDRNINTIIEESVKKVLSEMDLVPTDAQGEANLTRSQAINAWKMIYRLMDNVKTSMDATIEGKKKYDHYGKYASSNSITNQDVDNIIDYIYISNFYSEAIKIVGMKVYEGDTMIGELTDYIGTTIDANSSFTVSFSVTSTIQMPSVLPWIELTYTCNDEEYSKKSTDRATATAISIIKTNRDNNNTIYSLEGKKLKTIPSHGLYILNGKKYIAK